MKFSNLTMLTELKPAWLFVGESKFSRSRIVKLSSNWPRSRSARGWLFSKGINTIGLWDSRSGFAAASRRSPAVSQSELKSELKISFFAGTSSTISSSGLRGSEIAPPWRRSDLKNVLMVVPRSNACWSKSFLLFILLAALIRVLR